MTEDFNAIEEKITNLDLAYRSAIYEVYVDKQIIKIFIESNNPQIDLLLTECDRSNWAFITAYNPHSQCLSVAVNQQRHQSMIGLLEKQDYLLFDGVGKDRDGLWTPEISVLIVGIELKDAIALGKQFQQNAIVCGELDTISQLIWIEYR